MPELLGPALPDIEVFPIYFGIWDAVRELLELVRPDPEM